MKKLSLILLLLLLIIPIALSQEYYADVNIKVDESGYVTIKGKTNHPDLIVESSQEFTSKHNKYWLLNITTQDKFSDFIFELELPKNAEINYLKTPRLARIDNNLGHMKITGTGENQRFVIITQYSFQKMKTSYLYFVILFIVLIILIASFFLIKKNKLPKKKYNLDILTKRQREIFQLVRKNKKIAQAELEKKLDMPKSSLSRNIDSLEKKGFITKEKKGMTNMLLLK